MSADDHDSNRHNVEYVGSPTEYADAEEAPDWAQTLVKALFALPTVLGALSIIELALIGFLFACIAAFVILIFVL